ncbi:DnaJ homolog subfamily C member 1-like [Elysia marginata]|uniref:DnaJ homolog subfamily C member 1-like n=1 Tax=Elysia marginata TaxID=1093978 RepID=A0AAV4GZ31_9GAST|nr:DnaJ homolog subfamily C member 1-like [Elysia marginata]
MAAHISLCIFLIAALLSSCYSWDTDDLEIFDLVEEVNANFYDVFGISQSASTSEIRKAYRKLSLITHPDKNEAEDAAEKFRQVVAIYEILKDEQKRQKYNQVLVDGLPDWRQPVFYYRRARKMGVFELCVVLFIILTVGHYFVAWGFYIERRLVVEEVLNSKKKKRKKKQTASDLTIDDEEEQLQAIPTPRILDLWFFQLSRFLFKTVTGLPQTIKTWQEERERRKLEEEEELAQMKLAEEEVEEVKRKPKKKTPQELPEYTSEMYAKYSTPTEGRKREDQQEERELPREKKGEWSDEELVLLSKAVNKFPGGTHQRWEKIADMVGRSVAEVTAKTKETKGSYQMSLSSSVQSSDFRSQPAAVKISDNIISQPDSAAASVDEGDAPGQHIRKRQRPTKIPQSSERTLMISNKGAAVQSTDNGVVGGTAKLKPQTFSVAAGNRSGGSSGAAPSSNGTAVVSDTASGNAASKVSGSTGDGAAGKKLREPWTQNQQTIFEWALKQYPKGTEARWDKVADHIPGKSKEDCMLRFKELALLISQKKKNDQQQQQQ